MSENFICTSTTLESGSTGFNFQVKQGDALSPAFVIRYNDKVFAYLNQCAHLSLELDWEQGEFFDTSGDYIICSNHGAMFEPDTGECVNGPCFGAFLIQLAVEEADGKVILTEEGFEVDNQ